MCLKCSDREDKSPDRIDGFQKKVIKQKGARMGDLLIQFQPLEINAVKQEIIYITVHIAVEIIKPDFQDILATFEGNMLIIS